MSSHRIEVRGFPFNVIVENEVTTLTTEELEKLCSPYVKTMLSSYVQAIVERDELPLLLSDYPASVRTAASDAMQRIVSERKQMLAETIIVVYKPDGRSYIKEN